MKATRLASWESKLRPILTKFPPKTVVSKYSSGRLDFLEKLKVELPSEVIEIPEVLKRKLWGIEFRSPIMNAAGMFKNGECYDMVSMQGAGAYIAGTTTANSRVGNEKEEIKLPFVPYPKSRSASNWLGLPNEGDKAVAKKLGNLRKYTPYPDIPNFSYAIKNPIGVSVMGSPDYKGEEKLEELVHGMKLYTGVGVDFIEMNESCPNTAHGSPQKQIDELKERLRYVKDNFLDSRKRNLPVIVKFSNDTNKEDVHELLNILFDYGFDGVNFGNTSTAYKLRREKISESERKLFDYFTTTFGGGVSGNILKLDSLMLCKTAVDYVNSNRPLREFNVIRTGGIEYTQDIIASERIGVKLNQWYTGYMEGFAKHGHEVYKNFNNDLIRLYSSSIENADLIATEDI